jgi:hypothetical protein
VGNPFALGIPDRPAQYGNLSHALFKVQRGAESMVRDIRIAPDISRFLDVLTGKRIIKKSVFQNVLDDAEAKVIIPLCICKDWSFVR